MKKLLILTIIGLTILSCSRYKIEADTSDYSQYFTEKTIATDINFMPEETYINHHLNAPQTPTLRLKLMTVQQFPCINYGLNTTEFFKENELIIRFNEIVEQVACLAAIGPATSHIDLPENITKLTLINGSTVDKYSINISDEKITITPIKNRFTNSLYNKTFRIPENSFAYVCGTNTTNTDIYRSFLSILEQNASFKEFKFNGEGRIPYPKTSDGHWVNHPSKFFIYSNRTEFEKLDHVLNSYSSQNIEKNSGITIAIYGWDNSKYYSWD